MSFGNIKTFIGKVIGILTCLTCVRCERPKVMPRLCLNTLSDHIDFTRSEIGSTPLDTVFLNSPKGNADDGALHITRIPHAPRLLPEREDCPLPDEEMKFTEQSLFNSVFEMNFFDQEHDDKKVVEEIVIVGLYDLYDSDIIHAYQAVIPWNMAFHIDTPAEVAAVFTEKIQINVDVHLISGGFAKTVIVTKGAHFLREFFRRGTFSNSGPKNGVKLSSSNTTIEFDIVLSKQKKRSKVVIVGLFNDKEELVDHTRWKHIYIITSFNIFDEFFLPSLKFNQLFLLTTYGSTLNRLAVLTDPEDNPKNNIERRNNRLAISGKRCRETKYTLPAAESFDLTKICAIGGPINCVLYFNDGESEYALDALVGIPEFVKTKLDWRLDNNVMKGRFGRSTRAMLTAEVKNTDLGLKDKKPCFNLILTLKTRQDGKTLADKKARGFVIGPAYLKPWNDNSLKGNPGEISLLPIVVENMHPRPRLFNPERFMDAEDLQDTDVLTEQDMDPNEEDMNPNGQDMNPNGQDMYPNGQDMDPNEEDGDSIDENRPPSPNDNNDRKNLFQRLFDCAKRFIFRRSSTGSEASSTDIQPPDLTDPDALTLYDEFQESYSGVPERNDNATIVVSVSEEVSVSSSVHRYGQSDHSSDSESGEGSEEASNASSDAEPIASTSTVWKSTDDANQIENESESLLEENEIHQSDGGSDNDENPL